MYFIGMDLGTIGHFKLPKWGNHFFGLYEVVLNNLGTSNRKIRP